MRNVFEWHPFSDVETKNQSQTKQNFESIRITDSVSTCLFIRELAFWLSYIDCISEIRDKNPFITLVEISR